MVEILERTSVDLSRFERLRREISAGEPDFVRRLRDEALSRFTERGFPTVSDEDWRYTNVAPIAKIPWERGVRDASIPGGFLEPLFDSSAAATLVFINGRFSREHSAINPASGGAVVASLRDALSSHSSLVSENLGKLASLFQPFSALNAALFEDGAFVYVPDGASAGTVQLIFAGAGEASVISVPRILVVVGEAASLTLVEQYLTLSTEACFTASSVEILAGAGSVIDHTKVQRESQRSYHIATHDVHQMRDSSYHSHLFSIGGGLVRNNATVKLMGEGSSCTLDGLYLLDGNQHCDNHSIIDHVKPHATSVELFKGILGGKSRGIFDGKIIVEKDAQKTSARQTNKNLIVSRGATADSKPQLEIHADDVKCNHGSTIGQLDDDALFYLQARGIDRDQARNILTWAFASEIVERVRVESVRKQMSELLLAALPGDRA